MRQALHVVSNSSDDRATLALAVDAHNVPALRLYHRHGLRRIGSKLALMRDLRGEGRARDGESETSTNHDAHDATDALT